MVPFISHGPFIFCCTPFSGSLGRSVSRSLGVAHVRIAVLRILE